MYDGFGKLVTYANSTSTLATFAYDGDGRRMQKTAAGTTTVSHYDPAGRILAETDTAGRMLAAYIYANGTLVAKRDGAGNVLYYHTDALGTPQALTNISGQVVWRADYLPFGETHTVSATPAHTKRLLGKEFDPETGLADFGARALASDLGRFLTLDPVRAVDPVTSREQTAVVHNPQRLQLYGYGLNNPSRYVDPDGEFAVVPVVLGVWAVAEVALSLYDAYDTARTVASPEASPGEKGVALGLFAAGAMLPGGGYSQVDDAAKQVVKGGAKRAAKSVDDMAVELQQQLGKNSVSFRTPTTQGHIDLAGKSHFDKATQTTIPTPHVQTRPVNVGPNGKVNLGPENTRPATKQDIRIARELERRRGNL